MKYVITALTIIILCSGCKKDDDNSGGVFEAVVNGNLIQTDSAAGILLILTSPAERQFTIGGISGLKVITPGFTDSSSSPLLSVSNYNSVAAGAMLAYFDDADTVNIFDETPQASFEITSVDNANRKVSGKFSGVITDSFSGDSVTITNGSFTNISYQIW